MKDVRKFMSELTGKKKGKDSSDNDSDSKGSRLSNRQAKKLTKA